MTIRADFIDVLLPCDVPLAAWTGLAFRPSDFGWSGLPEALFWDTLDCALRRAGVALCTVAVEGRLRQALRVPDGLAPRVFVADVDGERPILAAARAAGWAGDASLTRVALVPRFRLTAHTLAMQAAGDAGSFMLVRGSVAAADASAGRDAFDIARVRVAADDPSRAWRLAGTIRDGVPGASLWFADEVDVGYALLQGGPRPPLRAVAHLGATRDRQRATTSVASVMLAHLCANVVGARNGDDPEHVHQMRLALRRLRAAARVARAAGLPLLSRRTKRWIRSLARALGETRDWDVLATATWPAVVKPNRDRRLRTRVEEAIARRRQERHAALRDVLSAPRLDELVLRLGVAAAGSGTRTRRVDGRAVARLLSKLARRVDHDHAAPERANASALHALRIDAKKLRYAVEIVAVAEGDDAARYVRRLAGVQSALGALNDLDVAGRCLRDLDIDAGDRAAVNVLWQRYVDRATPRLRREFVSAWKRFARAKRLWSP